MFSPAGSDFLDPMAESCKNFNLEFSPEDANVNVRAAHGKAYANDDIENTIAYALKKGCRRFDLFFMIGLGMQKREDVMQSLDYVDKLISRFGKRLYPFISPYSAALDPGSLAFEDPDKYGYRVFYRTLEEHYRSFTKPSWKYFFNYETKYLTVDDIIDLTYISAEKLAEIKHKHNLISEEALEYIKAEVKFSRNAMDLINSENKCSISSLEKPLLATNEEMSWDAMKMKTRIVSLILRGGMRVFK